MPMMPMLFISLTLSAILLAVMNAGKSPRGRVVRAAWMSVFSIVPVIISLSYFCNAAAVFLVAVVACGVGWGKREVMRGSIVVTALVYATFLVLEFVDFCQIRPEYPVVSVAARLSYETPEGSAPKPRLNAHSDEFLKDWKTEPRFGRTMDEIYAESLWKLHFDSVEWFIASPKFGIARMGERGSLPKTAWGETHPIDMPESELPIAPTSQELGKPTDVSEGSEPLRWLHRDSIKDFVNVPGWGYFRDRETVFSFRSHGFGSLPNGTPDWRVRRIELVSLLKGDQPSVYVADHLPRMDELVDAKSRPLDYFEMESLQRLRDGQDVLTQRVGPSMRMFGAIRAGEKCLRCHEVQVGSLLGAFSYELRRSD